MHSLSKWCLMVAVLGSLVVKLGAQCPDRPVPGSVVDDPLSLTAQNGTLSAQLVMKHSVDGNGYTHYCYKYNTGTQIVEAPTLRVNPGDELVLDILNRIENEDAMKMKMAMTGGDAAAQACGDGGAMRVDATNVHYHGMNVPPKCHQDDVIHTLIQPGTAGFKYKIPIPATQPPGLYWYHPHVHGFTEFQVNGGAAGALIVEGMEKIHPEVAGLTERVFVVRQQFLVPWIPGPYQLSINYQVSVAVGGSKPIIQMKPGEKQFWRVANATLQDFMPIQYQVNGKPQQVQLIAMDGYPLAQPRMTDTILLPPAGRAEFIVQAPQQGSTAILFTEDYSTGPTGNPDLQQTLGTVQLVANQGSQQASHMPSATASSEKVRGSDLASAQVTAKRLLYFSEEFGGTNGPIQFYITVDGQKQKVFDPNETPVIKTKVGAIEDWTIENRALETH